MEIQFKILRPQIGMANPFNISTSKLKHHIPRYCIDYWKGARQSPIRYDLVVVNTY